MKTIEVSADTHDILEALAREDGKSIGSYLESLPQVRQRMQKHHEDTILGLIDSKKFQFKDLNEKFANCLYLIYKNNPESFSRLNGFTKPGGRMVFVSKSESVIRESAASAKPVRLGDSGYWVNIQGGQHDFEYLIDMICSALGYSPAFKAALIQKVIRAQANYADLF